MEKEIINRQLYIKSFGLLFKVRLITSSIEEANNFCKEHKAVSVIAEKHGLIYITNNRPTKIKIIDQQK